MGWKYLKYCEDVNFFFHRNIQISDIIIRRVTRSIIRIEISREIMILSKIIMHSDQLLSIFNSLHDNPIIAGFSRTRAADKRQCKFRNK